ncbi:MAG: T9SS type A sorting domain-containing protein [Bacteroidetes bacterium]|nr:T9SS type A sorting domain-containing protein [Bacteroidota bacterium]
MFHSRSFLIVILLVTPLLHFSQDIITPSPLNHQSLIPKPQPLIPNPQSLSPNPSPLQTGEDSLIVAATPSSGQCYIKWDFIPGSYEEYKFDDGSAEELIVWANAGNENAVKFNTGGSPTLVSGGMIYVGDGSFPAGNWFGTDFRMIVYDDDGPGEMPGTALDSVTVTVNNYGWVEFWGLNALISAGNFYLSMRQLSNVPNSPPLGVDYSGPTYNYGYCRLQGNDWQLNVYQDLMIRAFVSEDPGISYYSVAWVEDMQSCDPLTGTLTVIGSTTENEFTDILYGQTGGFLRYAIQIVYQSSGSSGWFFSNLTGNNTTSPITFNMEMINGDPINNVRIDLYSLDCMNSDYTLFTGPDGSATEDSVYHGHYDIYAYKPGYDSISVLNVPVFSDTVFNWVMDELYLAPVNVAVDTQISVMSWDPPFLRECSREILSYFIFLDDTMIESGNMTSVQLPYMDYGTEHIAGIYAAYTTGNSDTIDVEFTSGYLAKPENLEGEPLDDIIHIWWDAPRIPDTTSKSRDMWDVRFLYPVTGVSPEYGIETDGNFIYTSQSTGNLINKYEEDGTFLFGFSIPGVSGLKDLAYDPDEGWMYGGDGGNTCYVMDFNSATLVRTFIAPVNIRAIAYDDDQDGLWTYNWNTDIVLFDKQGNLLQSFQTGTFNNYTGFAYDNHTFGTPVLWGFTSDGAEANLVQIDLTSGQEIFNIDVYSILGTGSAPSGGLFTHWMSGDFWTIGGVLQDEWIFGLELTTWPYYPGQGGIVPANLLGYNIHRDNEEYDFIEHNPGDTTAEYFDFGLIPGLYRYDVSALYDLGPYGQPGDTGESAMDGPIFLYNNSNFVLPFNEPWASGTFELNEWYHDTNWTIDGNGGNPAPAAKFTGEPALSNYSTSLTSWYINCLGVNQPYIDGEIWFEFDIRLDDLNPTGQEKLTVRAWCGEGWDTITTFDNSEGSFGWLHRKYNISTCAWGVDLFQIQFSCSGISSANIASWLIDNIKVYRLCPAPYNLESEEISWHDYLLTWHAPDYSQNRELLGYNVYIDQAFLEYTTDTFYYWVPQMGGEFDINVTATYEDCESYYSDTLAVNVPVGIEEKNDDGLFIFPNPADDYLMIRSEEDILFIKLFSPVGQIIYHSNDLTKSTRISTSHLPGGIFLVQITTKQGIATRKIIIQ